MRRSLLSVWLFCVLVVSCSRDAAQPPDASSVATQAQPLTSVAQYEPSLNVPWCRFSSTDCSSDTLLLGRGGVGGEPNAPNTLGGTCPDGEAGTFHVDGSVEAIQLIREGATLAEGRPVTVEVRVWGGTEPGELRLLHTADARYGRAWTQVGKASTVPGEQVLRFSFVLPFGPLSGQLHAVRAALGVPGGTGPCVPGPLHDHDDLAFTVEGTPRVRLASPSPGATLTGSVSFSALAEDANGIAQVEFRLGETVLGTVTAAPYTLTWDSRLLYDGDYGLTVRAVDTTGSETLTPPIPVTLRNGALPPTFSLTPADGSTVSGMVPLTVNVQDNQYLYEVRVTIDSSYVLCTSNDYASSVSLSCPWNTLFLSNGPHVIQVDAHDTDGPWKPVSWLATLTVNNEKTPPSVAFSAPSEGALLSGTVSLAVNATDDSGIRFVSFYLETDSGSRLLGQDTTAPYVLTWDTRSGPNGTHRLTALAEDGVGNRATSTPVTVLVDNGLVPPTVALTAPSPGATLTGTVTLTATATDNVGIARVDFYVGETLLGSDPSAPYSLAWNSRTSANGSQRLSARAFDVEGGEGTSASVQVTLNNDFVPPTVALLSPTHGATLTGPVSLQASASDDRGIARVEFHAGARYLGSDSTSPYQFTLTPSTTLNGSQVLTARAYDLAENPTTSAPVTVTLDNEFIAPTVSLTSPAAGARVDGTVRLEATASDNVSVTRVEFYAAGQYLGVDASAPYGIDWNTAGLTGGTTYNLAAYAYDPTGNVGAAFQTVTVHRNQPPQVTLLGPPAGSTLSGLVNLAVNASDDYGISRIEYYLDGVLLCSSGSAPYSVVCNTVRVANGNYSLRARAFDIKGLSTWSTGILVTLQNASDVYPPEVSEISPSDQSTVSGLVTLQARVTDDTGVTQADFHVGNHFIGTQRVTTNTRSFSPSITWDSTTVASGTYSLRVIGHDLRGKTTSRSVTLYVRNDSNPPLVTLTAPTSGAILRGSVQLTATARSELGPVSMEFYAGERLLGFSSGSSGLLWDTRSLPNGVYRLTARAYDVSETSSTSLPVEVRLDNDFTPPEVRLSSPAASAVLEGWVTLAAEASDASGISRVEFYDGEKLLSTDWAAPFELKWNTRVSTVANGTHTLTVRAYDSLGNVGTSTPVGVTVDNDYVAPAVRILSPVEGSTVEGTVTFTAEATDARGVTSVVFYLGNSWLGGDPDGTAPYSLSFDSRQVLDGEGVLTARAYDAAGNEGLSQVTFTLHNDHAAPTVSLTRPSTAAFHSGMMLVESSASDDIAVERVEYYLGTTRIGVSNSAPDYPLSWHTGALAEGVYPLTARAYDRSGKSATSAPVDVTLDQTAPAITSISPASGATVMGVVPVLVEASDVGGIARVDFHTGEGWAHTDLEAPFQMSWNTRAHPNGSRVLTVKVSDKAGNVTTLATTVTLNNDFTAPTVSLTAPTAGATLSRTVTLSATASDDVSVTRVEFYVGGTLVGTDTSAPYSVTWDSTRVANGTHILTAKAYDAAGNVGTGAGVSVTVKNGGK